MAGMVEVLDARGWQREYPLEKNIIYIGSAPDSDIVLESTSDVTIALRHLQLVSGAGVAPGYRLVNLSDREIVIESANGSEDKAVASSSSSYIITGDKVTLGSFTLVFHNIDSAVSNTTMSRGEVKNINIAISLPQKQVRPKRTLEGMIIIRNLGEQSGVQFDLELEGLDAECYEIGPRPILFSGDEKSVLFSVHHLGEKPMAGHYRIVIRATTEAYPLETAMAVQNLEFLPYYHHKLTFFPTDEQTEGAKAAPAKEPKAKKEEPASTAVATPAPSVEKESWGKRITRWLSFRPSAAAPTAKSAEVVAEEQAVSKTTSVSPSQEKPEVVAEEQIVQEIEAAPASPTEKDNWWTKITRRLSFRRAKTTPPAPERPEADAEEREVAVVSSIIEETKEEIEEEIKEHTTPPQSKEPLAQEMAVAEEAKAHPAPRTVEAEDVAALRDAIIEEVEGAPSQDEDAVIAKEEETARSDEEELASQAAVDKKADIISSPEEQIAPREITPLTGDEVGAVAPKAEEQVAPRESAPREQAKAWWLEDAETVMPSAEEQSLPAKEESAPREQAKAWWLEDAETVTPSAEEQSLPAKEESAPREQAKAWWLEDAETVTPSAEEQAVSAEATPPAKEEVAPREQDKAWWLEEAETAAPAAEEQVAPRKAVPPMEEQVMPRETAPAERKEAAPRERGVSLPEGEGVLTSKPRRRRGDAWWLEDAQDAKEVERSLTPDVKLPEIKEHSPTIWWEEEAEPPPEMEEEHA